MFAIEGLDHVVIRVDDLPRALAFYRDLLGCPLEREVSELGLFQLRAGSALIDLVSVDGALGRKGGRAPGAEGRNMDHLCLRIDPFDAEAIIAWLDRNGVSHSGVESRYGAEGQGPSIYIEDPEGNTVELKASRRASQAQAVENTAKAGP